MYESLDLERLANEANGSPPATFTVHYVHSSLAPATQKRFPLPTLAANRAEANETRGTVADVGELAPSVVERPANEANAGPPATSTASTPQVHVPPLY